MGRMEHLARELMVRPGSRIKLADIDPGDTHGVRKPDAEERLAKNRDRVGRIHVDHFAQYLIELERQSLDEVRSRVMCRDVRGAGFQPKGPAASGDHGE